MIYYGKYQDLGENYGTYVSPRLKEENNSAGILNSSSKMLKNMPSNFSNRSPS